MNPSETTQQRISKRSAEYLQQHKKWGESLAETLDRILFTEKKVP